MGEDFRIIVTPNNHEVKLKSFITGYDLRQIEQAMYKNISLKGGVNPEIEGFSTSALAEAEDKTFEIVILSVDGKTTDLVKEVLSLPAEDYLFVKKAVEEVTGKKS